MKLASDYDRREESGWEGEDFHVQPFPVLAGRGEDTQLSRISAALVHLTQLDNQVRA